MIRKIALLLVLGALLLRGAAAFQYPLSSEQVREAYFLGGNLERRQAFFDRYIRYPKQPDRGPDVHLVEFRTPYELVARRSQEQWANYSVLDAEQEYATHPEEVSVRVLIICGTYRFGLPLPPAEKTWEDYLKEFEFRVSQNSPIRYKKLTVVGSGCVGFGDQGFNGVEVLLHFDGDQFGPGDVKVEVVAPGGQIYSARFDLDQLL